MTEPEKQFVIGINTEVERPAGWTAGQGGNLTFTASTLATDLAAALARYAALETAARDCVSLLYDAGAYSGGAYHSACRECGALIGPATDPPVWTAPPHRADCLVVTLMALLEESTP